jgi:hypothetical protein
MNEPNVSYAKTSVNFIDMLRVNPGDRLFSPINDLLIILSAISHASSLIVDADVHTDPHPAMRVNTSQFDYAFVLPIPIRSGPLEQALREKTPAYIEIGTTSNDDIELEGAKLKTRGLNEIAVHIISLVFLAFFDQYKDWLDENMGRAINWPPTLNFCRVVRNACAHGAVHIRDPSAPPVTWRGLSFGPADNGRQIIGQDLRIGDMIGLMFEANKELDRVGAPIL